MQRCYIEPEPFTSDEVTLDRDQSRHMITVLRLNEGDELCAFDGCGNQARATVTVASRESVTLRLDERKTLDPPPVEITLVQALVRNPRLELLVQKSVELGVTGIQPVMTDHCVVKAGGSKDDRKLDRIERIVTASMKQCGRPWRPCVGAITSLETCLSAADYDLMLVCSLEDGAIPLGRVVEEQARSCKRIALFVGPEGDFSPAEYAVLREAGAVPVALGDAVLRSETAAIAAVAILTHGLWG